MGRPNRSLAEQLVDQARADGRNLVGPGGLPADLVEQVLETGLEGEMEDHVGYEKQAVEGRNGGNSRNGTRSKTRHPATDAQSGSGHGHHRRHARDTARRPRQPS